MNSVIVTRMLMGVLILGLALISYRAIAADEETAKYTVIESDGAFEIRENGE